jgi:FG-GAP-like repeat/PASTA domain
MRKLVVVACLMVLTGSLGAGALFAGSAPSFTGQKYATGSESSSVAIGDLNGDGKPDLATANGRSNTVSLPLNRGDGSFQARLDYRTGRGPSSVAVDDLNGDAKPDLAIANGGVGEHTVSVLLNSPGLCTVQGVREKTLPAARRALARGNCRIGKVRRIYQRFVKKGRVISETPRLGTVLPSGAKVNLVVSRGRRHS